MMQAPHLLGQQALRSTQGQLLHGVWERAPETFHDAVLSGAHLCKLRFFGDALVEPQCPSLDICSCTAIMSTCHALN